MAWRESLQELKEGLAEVRDILQPEIAALAATRAKEAHIAALDDADTFIEAKMMMLSLSCDHRVIDGACGAQFLQTLADLIEEPSRHLS